MTQDQSAPWKSNAIEGQVVASAPVEEPEVDVNKMVEGSSELMVPDESAVQSTASRTYSSNPDLGMEELLIPRLRLAQGQTAEVLAGEAKPGQWVLVGNEPSDEVELVVLAMGRARELRVKGGDDDGNLLCKSKDAILGEGDPGGVCAVCPMQEWGQNPTTGRRQQPRCAQIYSYQVFSVTHNCLALVEFKRTGLDSAKMINTMIAGRGMGNFIIKLSGNKREAGEGRQKFVFYAPAVTARPIDQETKDLASMFMPA